jgi:hypothetical protein
MNMKLSRNGGLNVTGGITLPGLSIKYIFVLRPKSVLLIVRPPAGGGRTISLDHVLA